MTDKPYTDADIKLVALTFIAEAKKNPITPSTPPWFGASTRMLLGPTEHDIARAVLDALARAGRLKPPTTDAQVRAGADALVRLRTTAPALSELDREEQSFWLCDAAAVLEAAGPLADAGRCGDVAPSLSLLASRIRQTCRLTAGHAGWHRGADGSEWGLAVGGIVDSLVDADHPPAGLGCRHSELCAQARPPGHVIAFAGDGTWSLEHPTGCPPGSDPSATDWDCPVRRLAEQQITADLAALMAGGRYGCSISELRDVFQLDDRLHDDQCTPPVCAACGCWCHAEEQPAADAALRNADIWGPEPPCFHCGEREADHVDGRCPTYRPTEREG